MDMKLVRIIFDKKDGIFGELYDDRNVLFCLTLERFYDDGPKLPSGEYVCKKGEHKLSDLVPFKTFEVKGVPGHTGILFHVGNYNKDSSGCILMGSQIGRKLDGGRMLASSRATFNKFMDLQKDVDSFRLTVE